MLGKALGTVLEMDCTEAEGIYKVVEGKGTLFVLFEGKGAVCKGTLLIL
jgi:hypothetical protein